MLKRQRKGFTLIELLVVIAIIGLLSTLAVVALNGARAKARDAKRVADIRQVQTALDLYSNDSAGYPGVAAAGINLGSTSAACLGTGGFAVTGCVGAVMGMVPAPPTAPGADYTSYVYRSFADDGTTACPTTPCAKYSITFALEGNTGDLTDVEGASGDTNKYPNCVAKPEGIPCI